MSRKLYFKRLRDWEREGGWSCGYEHEGPLLVLNRLGVAHYSSLQCIDLFGKTMIIAGWTIQCKQHHAGRRISFGVPHSQRGRPPPTSEQSNHYRLPSSPSSTRERVAPGGSLRTKAHPIGGLKTSKGAIGEKLWTAIYERPSPSRYHDACSFGNQSLISGDACLTFETHRRD